jgi:hypothetical protein
MSTVKTLMGRSHKNFKNKKPLWGAHTGKMGKVMGEYKSGMLHSGSKKGPKVTNRKQAVAIALSESRKAK